MKPGERTPLEERRERTEALEKRRRVGNLVAGVMIGLALFFDILQFFLFFLNVIPVAGTAIAFMGDIFITALAFIIFYLVWFPLLGVPLSKGKSGKLVNVIFSAVIETVPILDILPGISYGVVSTIILSRMEDTEYNKKNAARRAQVLAETRARRQAQVQQVQQNAFIEQQNELQAANDDEAAEEESAQEAA